MHISPLIRHATIVSKPSYALSVGGGVVQLPRDGTGELREQGCGESAEQKVRERQGKGRGIFAPSSILSVQTQGETKAGTHESCASSQHFLLPLVESKDKILSVWGMLAGIDERRPETLLETNTIKRVSSRDAVAATTHGVTLCFSMRPSRVSSCHRLLERKCCALFLCPRFDFPPARLMSSVVASDHYRSVWSLASSPVVRTTRASDTRNLIA